MPRWALKKKKNKKISDSKMHTNFFLLFIATVPIKKKLNNYKDQKATYFKLAFEFPKSGGRGEGEIYEVAEINK